jgi:tetratricopeptide (TPR) repeat protein
MKADRREFLLTIGVFLSAALCFVGAFFAVYHSSLYPAQGTTNSLVPIEAWRPTPAKSMMNGSHEEMLIDALRKKPDHTPILLELARQETESGNARKASAHLKEALQYDPKNVDAKLDLGKLMFEMGDIEEAIRLNQEILKVQPAHPDALYNLGAIYGNLENRERALFFWNQLIDTNPDSESGIRAKKMMARL